MFTKLTFKNDKAGTLAKMMKHSNAHKRRIPYTQDETEDQGLWLVKDEGIYLMSPTAENFIMSNDVNTVVYARGYKPTKANRDTLWDKTHAVSGDDFAEFVRLTPNMVRNVLRGGDITIELGETQMAVTA
jgi:hypothetical protein